MQWHLRKENEVVLSSRWQFQDGGSKGMGGATQGATQRKALKFQGSREGRQARAGPERSVLCGGKVAEVA